jgi:hypothetical protein
VTHFMHSRNCELITRRGSVRATPKGSQHTHLCAAASMTCLTIAACHARIRPGQPCAAAPQPSTRFRIHAGDGSLARGIDVFAPGSGMCRAAAIRAEVRVPSRPPRLDTAEHRRAGHPLRRLAFALGIGADPERSAGSGSGFPWITAGALHRPAGQPGRRSGAVATVVTPSREGEELRG